MKLHYKDLEEVLEIGIELASKKDRHKLLVNIIEKGMSITNCDAATIYLYRDDELHFKVMKTISQNVSRGENDEYIHNMTPVPLNDENVCAYAAIHRKIVNIPDVYHCQEFDFSGPKRYDAASGYRSKSMLVVPLVNDSDELVGVLQMINAMREDNSEIIPFDKEYEIIIQALGAFAAIAIANIRYMAEVRKQLYSFVEAMAITVDERVPYNGSHTKNVVEYSLFIADIINRKHAKGLTDEFFDDDRKDKLELAALLHDIGKVVIPRDIMNRATKLSGKIQTVEDRLKLLRCYYRIDYLEDRIPKEEYEKHSAELKEAWDLIHKINEPGVGEEKDYEEIGQLASRYYETPEGEKIYYLSEWERDCLSVRKGTLTQEMRNEVQNHVVMTSRILSKVRLNKNYESVAKWAGEHHEFLDGSGYPKGMKGEELCIESRILTIADIFEALTAEDRPYKKPMAKKEAVSILKGMAGEGKLDTTLVDWLDEAIE